MAYESETEKLRRKYEDKPEQWFAALADHHRKGNELDEALRIVRDGLLKRPNYVSGHIVLGRCLVDNGNDVEAEGVFEQVLILDPENIIALRTLGEISNRAGDTNSARRWLTRLLEVDPMNEEAQDALDHLQHDDYAPPAAAVADVAETPIADSPADAPEWSTDPVAPETTEPSPGSGRGEEDLGEFEIKPYPSYDASPPAPEAEPVASAANGDALEIEHDETNWGEMTSAPVGEVDIERSDASPWSREEIEAADEADVIDTSVDESTSRSDMLPHEIPEPFPTLSPDPTGEDFAPGFEPVSLDDVTGNDSPAEAEALATSGPDPYAAASPGETPGDVGETDVVEDSSPSDEAFEAAFAGESPGDAHDADVVEQPSSAEDGFEAAFAGEAPGDVVAPPSPAEGAFEAAFAGETTEDVSETGDAEPSEPTESQETEPMAHTEPPLTETMAEVYARQGMIGEARRVYARLLEANPDDEGLRRRMEALDERSSVGTEAPAAQEKPPEPAVSEGTSVRALLAGILAARLPSGEAEAPSVAAFESEPPEPGVAATEVAVDLEAPAPAPADLTPLEAAFADLGVDETADQPEYSEGDVPISAILEPETPSPAPALPVEAEPADASHSEASTSQEGMSFDQFFGGVTPEEQPPIPESLDAPPAAEEDDEEEFKAWLKSLKS